MTTLASFNGANGANPFDAVIADANGNLLGTTNGGGAYGDGMVFEIAKTAGGYASTPTTVTSFNGVNGANPYAGLIVDAKGNLFGTTQAGGASGYGTVFEVAKTEGGYASTPTALTSFNGTDGASPFAGLIVDTEGNLFGTTEFGGDAFSHSDQFGFGTVFEVAKTARGYASTPTTLVSFDAIDGEYPLAGLIVDAEGNLFGTTVGLPSGINGMVFEVVKTARGYATTSATLVRFDGTNGALPLAGLTVDANGNLFGTTNGGGAYGNGTVFEVVKTAGGYASTPITLISFDGANGAHPYAGIIVDANGNLFGTTQAGGAYGDGTVFELARTAGGYASTPTILVSFNGTGGAYPYAGLIVDAHGNLFGTTGYGGAYGDGTVFEITSSGFVPWPVFAGTPGKPNCHSQSILDVTKEYGGLAAAAAVLGYSSVQVLQNDVDVYCAGP